jgi:hypothetical protein
MKAGPKGSVLPRHGLSREPTELPIMANNAGPETAAGTLLLAGEPLPHGRATPRNAEAAAGPGTGPREAVCLIFRESRLIGIGAAVTRRPLPHHRAYGPVHGGSSRLR